MDLKKWLEMLAECQNQDESGTIRMFINILVKTTIKRLADKKNK